LPTGTPADRGPGSVAPIGVVGQGLQDGLELRAGFGGFQDVGDLPQVAGDLGLAPGEQNRFDVGEVPVQCGASDAGLRGDSRHRLRGKGVRRLQARSAKSSLDRLGSEFGSGADAELREYVNKVGLDCRA
jgi:hypothetical protein